MDTPNRYRVTVSRIKESAHQDRRFTMEAHTVTLMPNGDLGFGARIRQVVFCWFVGPRGNQDDPHHNVSLKFGGLDPPYISVSPVRKEKMLRQIIRNCLVAFSMAAASVGSALAQPGVSDPSSRA